MTVGERIIQLREQKGISTNKLANLAGVSQSHLREIERGTRNPTVETLSYFCEALGISLSQFFEDKNNEINPFLLFSISKLTNEQQEALANFLNTIK